MLDHPAVLFGRWLSDKRRSSGVVARVFAGRIGLSPAEYAEVESGILHWLKEKQELKIPIMLDFDESTTADFNYKLRIAREAKELDFADVYTREELAPARCCSINGEQISEKTRNAIIDAVFTPLPRDT